ncbi:MAG TPA: GlxA family transcriptional regulator [Actinophytocola sp.]|nr:GlxA family transcriptional regulator [Actinophytocola sp.]
MAARRVVIVVFPGVQLLDVAGPLEVFRGAAQLVPGAYAVDVVGPGPVTASNGIALTPDGPLPDDPVDTLLVAGGPGVSPALRDGELTGWLAGAVTRARRVGSVCSGALLLGEVGVLDGRRATTHWAAAAVLAQRYPSVTVEGDRLYVRDGHVWTSAGVTTGMDLALAMVEEDLGREVALEVARWLVWFARRPGGQAQFAGPLVEESGGGLREVRVWILANLTADLRVAALAERACMSQRNFARTFRREVGLTPGAYVERARVEAARRLLTTGEDGTEAVAVRCGFGTAETMRRAFHRQLGVGPAEYRDRFRPSLNRE